MCTQTICNRQYYYPLLLSEETNPVPVPYPLLGVFSTNLWQISHCSADFLRFIRLENCKTTTFEYPVLRFGEIFIVHRNSPEEVKKFHGRL